VKARSTKKALLASLLSLVVCVSLLVGSTFAWFTDSVTSAQNVIQSGNLDVELYYTYDATVAADPDSNAWVKVDENTNVFGYNLWEPGFTKVAYFKVVNEGSLALKYSLSADVYDEKAGKNQAGESFLLSNYIKTSLVEVGVTRDEVLALAGTPLKNSFAMSGEEHLTAKGTAGASKVVGMAIWMPTTVGNDANHDGTNVPEITFGINLFATQDTVEADSFDKFYDKDAYLPVVYNIDELKAALADGQSVRLGADIASEDGFVIDGDKNVTIDLGGKTITVSEGASTNNRIFKVVGNAELTVKNGTLVAEGTITDGAYGTIRTEENAKVTVENAKLYSYRGYGLNVKAMDDSNVTINNSEIYSQYGGGVEAAGGTIELNNTKIVQEGVYSDAAWCSVAIGVNGGGKVVVNSGEYSAKTIATDSNADQGTWVAYVMSSGGTLEINGGTFNGKVAETATAANACGIICADRAAVVEINGGTFNSNGAILDMRNNVGTLPNPVATLKGGTFSADPRVSGLYSSNLITVADGHTVTDNGDGTWTVIEGIIYNASTMGGLYEYLPTLSNGTVLILPEATYNIGGTLKVAAGVTIRGAEGAEVVFHQNSSAQDDIFNCEGDVVFENITFESNRKGYAITYKNQDHNTDGDITVINCKFKGIATEKNYGIYKNLNGNLTVKNCTFDNYNNALCGINNGNGSTTVVTGCTFTNINGEAIGYVSSTMPANFEADVIANNTGLTAENVIGY